MATYVGRSSGGASSSESGIFNAVAGNLIVVGTRNDNGIVNSISDTAGNTYKKYDAVIIGVTHLEIWYANNILGNVNNNVGVNFSSPNTQVVIAVQYSPTNTFDIDPITDISAAKGTAASGLTVTSDSFTTTFETEVLVGFAQLSAVGAPFTIVSGPLVNLRGNNGSGIVTLFDLLSTEIVTGGIEVVSSSSNAAKSIIIASFFDGEPSPPAPPDSSYKVTLSQGNVYSLEIDKSYALPPKLSRIAVHTTGSIQTSDDDITFVTASLTNNEFNTAAKFIRVHSAVATISVKSIRRV